MDRGVAQPTQSGVVVKLRKGSLFAEKLFDAWLKKDTTGLDAIKMIQKFEFIDGTVVGNCVARMEEYVLVAINNFSGEAGDYLSFEIDIHYANKSTLGEMSIIDGETIEFTPASVSA